MQCINVATDSRVVSTLLVQLSFDIGTGTLRKPRLQSWTPLLLEGWVDRMTASFDSAFREFSPRKTPGMQAPNAQRSRLEVTYNDHRLDHGHCGLVEGRYSR
jgi:hypothetical protein